MQVLALILKHVNIMTLVSLMMTPYNSQVRVMRTPYTIQLLEALLEAEQTESEVNIRVWQEALHNETKEVQFSLTLLDRTADHAHSVTVIVIPVLTGPRNCTIILQCWSGN